MGDFNWLELMHEFTLKWISAVIWEIQKFTRSHCDGTGWQQATSICFEILCQLCIRVCDSAADQHDYNDVFFPNASMHLKALVDFQGVSSPNNLCVFGIWFLNLLYGLSFSSFKPRLSPHKLPDLAIMSIIISGESSVVQGMWPCAHFHDQK